MRVGDVIAGRFELKELAGSGGTAMVYRARALDSGRAVALKLIEKSADPERFLREARVLAGLRHPAIVRYLDHGPVPGGGLYLAMEWLEGETLSRRLRRGALAPNQAVGLVMRLADALSLAHQKGIVHRDIKPGNVLLVEAEVERAKLLDFGVARVFDPDGFVTLTGAVLGTPGYMAPEQARGEPDVDSRADVFALGCLLYQGLTGRAAFAAKAPLAVLAKLILQDPPRIRELRRDLPRALDNLVARMLAKDPDQRPRDGAAVVRELRGFDLRDGAVPERASTRPPEVVTDAEQRVACAIVARGVLPAEDEDEPATVPEEAAPRLARRKGAGERLERALSSLREAATEAGGRLDPLRDGSVIVTLAGVGSATDLAAGAARTALAIQRLFPRAPIAVGTGRAVVSSALPLGEVIDRAVELLGAALPAQILVDAATAGLLDVRFEVAPTPDGHLELGGQRTGADSTRFLLGKPTPTVGRERELDFLLGVLDDCIGEPMACATLVTGPPGVGKSRLRYEFLRRVRKHAPETRVWLARAEPASQGSPFSLIGQLLRGIAHVRDGEPTRAARERLREHIARRLEAPNVERATQFLGEAARIPPERPSEAFAAARNDPILMHDQIQWAWEDFIVAECSAGPVLLAIEDMHWADLPSVKLVDAALRAAEYQPLMALGLARPEVNERFPRLWSHGGGKTLTLGGLTRRAARKLAVEALGPEADEQLVSTIVERADGNPFFLEELIRAVSEGDATHLPDTVLAMLQTRLEALPDGARRVLRAASVFGKVFWQRPVALLLGETEDWQDIGEWIELLAERELITEDTTSRFDGERELSFRHALVADAAYGMLTPEDRVRAHQAAAEWLETSGESDIFALAAHHEHGGNTERALSYLQQGAQKAIDGNDFATALDAVARARALLPEDDHTQAGRLARSAAGKLARLEAEAHLWRGENDLAKQLSELAFASLPEQSDDWYRAIFVLASACQQKGEPERAAEIAELLLDSSAWENPTTPLLVSGSRAALVLTQAGRFEIADQLLERLERIAPALTHRDAAALALWLATKATHALYHTEIEKYLCWSMLASDTFERVGDLRNATIQRHNGGHASNELGAYREAERHLREVLSRAERLGIPNVLAGARNNLGFALTRLGRFDEARPLLVEAERLLEQHGDQRMRGGALNHLAELELLEGNLERAEQTARQAVSVLEPYPPVRAQAIATLTEVLLAQGKTDEALERQYVRRRAARLARGTRGRRAGSPARPRARAHEIGSGGTRAAGARAGARAAHRARLQHRGHRAPEELSRADPRKRAHRRVVHVYLTRRHDAAWRGSSDLQRRHQAGDDVVGDQDGDRALHHRAGGRLTDAARSARSEKALPAGDVRDQEAEHGRFDFTHPEVVRDHVVLDVGDEDARVHTEAPHRHQPRAGHADARVQDAEQRHHQHRGEHAR